MKRRNYDLVTTVLFARKSLYGKRVRPRCECDARHAAIDVIRELAGDPALDVIVPEEGIQLRAASTPLVLAVACELWFREGGPGRVRRKP